MTHPRLGVYVLTASKNGETTSITLDDLTITQKVKRELEQRNYQCDMLLVRGAHTWTVEEAVNTIRHGCRDF